MEDEHNKREHEPYFLCLQRVAISDRERKRGGWGGGGGDGGDYHLYRFTFFTLSQKNV